MTMIFLEYSIFIQVLSWYFMDYEDWKIECFLCGTNKINISIEYNKKLLTFRHIILSSRYFFSKKCLFNKI